MVSSSSQAGTTVHVTDSAGKVLYSGPYNTPEEKEAVPEAVRERLKNIETNFCFYPLHETMEKSMIIL